MIKSITSTGHVVVSGGYHNHPYVSPGSAGAGMLRWNFNTNEMEVNDGAVWLKLSTNGTTVGLSPQAQQAIDWAIQRQQEEADLESRIQRHPGLRDTWERFKIMDALTREEDARQPNS